MNILRLKQEIEVLIYRSNEVETDEERELIYGEIESLESLREEKLNALADLADDLDKKIGRMNELLKVRKAILSRTEFVVEALLMGEPLETDEHSFKFRKSTAVIVNSPELLPESFLRIIPERWEPDKIAIGKSLKAGEEVAGAILEERSNLQIK